MNIEEALRLDAHAQHPNTVAARLPGITQSIRRRRRARAAGGSVACVAAAAAVAVGVWQWRAPAPPPEPPATITQSPTASPSESAEPTEEPTTAEPTQAPTSPEPSAEPSDEVLTNAVGPTPSFNPACGDEWSPPAADNGWNATFEIAGDQTYATGATDGLTGTVTLSNSSQARLSTTVYLWVVLTQDGHVVARPEVSAVQIPLSSQEQGDMVEIGPAEQHVLTAYSDLTDCSSGEALSSGSYVAHVMAMDWFILFEQGDRSMLAVSNAVPIEVQG